MAIYSGGRSTAIDSPRHLTLRHARRVIAREKRARNLKLATFEDVPEPDLNPGEEKLNSFWAPSLEAGVVHQINVRQIVDPKNGQNPLEMVAEQQFNVDAPQFSLPEGSIHSTYPPAGYSDDHRILPHVVLTDPHLPWERFGGPPAPDGVIERNRVPWVALLLFTQDELTISPEDLDIRSGIFKDTSLPELGKPIKQSPTMALSMVVGDILSTTNIATPIKENLGPKDARGDFIFIKPDLFTSLFSSFDSSGQRQTQVKPDTSQYQYLSHVRKINSTGMALAGVEDIGIFSVVIGNRSGPLDNTTPTSVSVHLVSLEGVQNNMAFPIKNRYVSLCSLHSWNYTVLPPAMLNVPDAFRSLGETLDVLRAPESVISNLKPKDDLSARLAQRLHDGYTLLKYRTQTGEETVAMYRGPLTPTTVPRLSVLDKCSNSGLDFQIMDKEIGVMDITYSSAWNLGRTLALGDQAFTAALSRVRTAIHQMAMKSAKIDIIKKRSKNAFRTRRDVLQDLPSAVENLSKVQLDGSTDRDQVPFGPGGPLKRWHRYRLRADEFPDLSFESEEINEIYLEHAKIAAGKLALSKDGNIYDESNIPVSSDWMILLAWVMNRMFLAGVPSHYLITDPTHLPREGLRFFHIDANWVDALVDGSLSLANHMGNDKDRVAIKECLNQYIRAKPEFLPHAPQIPTYGFFLRSDLVTMFPDLKVTTLPETLEQPTRAPLLRHEIPVDGVMMCLFDRLPGSSDFDGLVFTQPPHQQRFAVAARVETSSINIIMRRQYTVNADIRRKDKKKNEPLDLKDLPTKPSDPDNLFIWGSQPGLTDLRILRLPRFAAKQRQALYDNMGFNVDENTKAQTRYFDDDTPTSALLAMQLNDPIYNLTINFDAENTRSALAGLGPPPDTAEESFRVLKSLIPSQVTKFVDVPALDPEENLPRLPLPDHDALTAAADFTRPVTYEPDAYVLSALAPDLNLISESFEHPFTLKEETEPFTASIIQSSSNLAPGLKGDDPPASAPKYECRVYTRGFKSVQTDSRLARDLVFSVYVSNNDSDYSLREYNILIPIGVTDQSDTYLLRTYDGPGPRMLSNLRFNVLASFQKVDGTDYLTIRLIPRSNLGYISIRKVIEMSFLLSLAIVNPLPRKEEGAPNTVIEVRTLAFYGKVKDQVIALRGEFPILLK